LPSPRIRTLFELATVVGSKVLLEEVEEEEEEEEEEDLLERFRCRYQR